MKQPKRIALYVLLLTNFACSAEDPPVVSAEPKRPNILFIVADDLGYSDLGIYGSEIPTPNLDALARGGMILDDFYAAMTCSPTRAMLMSGIDSHLSGLGSMSRPRSPEQEQSDGYVGYLNFNVASLGDLMTDAGYDTYMTGKWHLGLDAETSPLARGFKRSFVSLDGAAHLGSWGWQTPTEADYRRDADLEHVDASWYSTRDYTNLMQEFIAQDHAADRPFFAYLAYHAPHWPLQAPKESIAKFKGWYDAGYEALYQQRLDNMKALGLVAQDLEPADASIWSRRWSELSADEQAIEARKMEVYAAMVSDMDHYVGELIAYLKSIGEYDNTFIMFMADNGAEPGRQTRNRPEYDNSLENLGAANSYFGYGPDWAAVSALPYRDYKFSGFDGGIHVPAFAHFPPVIPAGVHSDGHASVLDVLPTFLDLAGTQHPGAMYRGNAVLTPPGRSLLPLLSGAQDRIHDDTAFTGWELWGNRSVRQGDWKIVWDDGAGDAAAWMLFNIADDPAERVDLAAQQPDKLAAMIQLWDRYAEENGVLYVRGARGGG